MSFITARQRRRLELLVNDIPLPKIWFNPQTSAPFQQCSQCGNPINADTEHLIEKVIENRHEVHAYALCMPCVQQFQSQLSIGSRQTVRNWFEAHTRMGARINALATREKRDPEAWIDACISSGVPSAELDAYHLLAHARGTRLITGAMPYLISGACMTALQEILSEDTREANRRFLEQHLGSPPQRAKVAAKAALLV